MKNKYISIIDIARYFLNKNPFLDEDKLQSLCFITHIHIESELNNKIIEVAYCLEIPRYKALMRNERLISNRKLRNYIKTRIK